MCENKVEAGKVNDLQKPFFIDKDLQRNIYEDCFKLGCCERCCARFAYYIVDCPKEDTPRITAKPLIQEHLKDEWKLVRNERAGHCAVCLGVLEERTVQEVLKHKGIHLLDGYHSADFVLECSIPLSSSVRERCMMIHLKEKFGPRFPLAGLEISSIKQVFYHLLYTKLARLTSKVPRIKSRITLKVILQYPLDIQEANKFCKISGTKHDDTKVGVRRTLLALSTTSDEKIKYYMKVPPERSILDLILANVFCRSGTIILRGLFNRYSRLLPQISQTCRKKNVFKFATILKTAVQDVLDDDDLDVNLKTTQYFIDQSRILGRGEVMHLEIIKSKHPCLREEQLQAIEQHINKYNMVGVKDLHQINKITKLRRGPVECCKILCMVFDKDLEECLNCINNICGEVQVTQRQPIRWLSSKKLDSRSATIYKFVATSVPGKTNMLEVCLWLKASKLSFAFPEFVHGDFGRTKPSLSDLVGTKMDILAIDHIAEETFT